MFPKILLVCLVVFSKSEAVLNILGDDTTIPLIPWDSNDLRKILAPESEIWQTCRKNGVKGDPMAVLRGTVNGCISKMQGIQGKTKGEDEEVISKNCEKLKTFHDCMQSAWGNVKDKCALEEDDEEYVDNIEKISGKITTLLCEEDARRIVEFSKEGNGCEETKHKELEQCVANYSRIDMEYDTDDCRRAWGFVGCVEDTLEDCKEGASHIPVEVMSEGLMVTACKDKRISGSSALVPVTILTLAASYFALNFV